MALILPDVNVLVYAFREDASEHEPYAAWIDSVRGRDRLALAEPVLLGFIRVMTDPRIFARPVTAKEALTFIGALRGAALAFEIGPTNSTWTCLRRLAERDRGVRGKLIPDAWLAALAISHGARLATADRGFARFDELDWFTPVPTES